MVRDVHLKNIVERVRGLSDREQQITNLVCDGLSNKVIATRLGLSVGTVKAHLHRIIRNFTLGAGANSSHWLCLAKTRSEELAPERPVSRSSPFDGKGCISCMSSSSCVHGRRSNFQRTCCEAKRNALASIYILRVPGTSRDYPQGSEGGRIPLGLPGVT